MKKQTLINIAYNVAHSLIIWVIGADICTAIGRNFPKYELPIFLGLIGLFVGGLFGGVWEKYVEPHLLRMPESKGDLINMIVCGTLAGISCAYIAYDFTFLLISSIISTIFVVLYFVRMWRSRLTRKKIDY